MARARGLTTFTELGLRHVARLSAYVCYFVRPLPTLRLATGDDGGSIPSAAVPPAAGVEALAADVAVAAKIAAKTLKFKLDTPEGIAAFVAWALQPRASTGTMAFHWKTWGNGVDKKGFLQSYLIV
ncbi:hypothetical protein B0H13DRAFT_2317500 [Mycena leptocephala]|nr:hypothetical protein B0H13DRAFT_2317500 [Mycena leptocephala]